MSRSNVNWVLRGLLLQGHEFGAGEDDARPLSRKTIGGIRAMYLREQMVSITDDALDCLINHGGDAGDDTADPFWCRG